ncbi:ABC transporter substrate-binding protein [Thermogymnomonas acidicola]|uniref:ABC transporter substrate-binding protein n=1 Tax=Thermogymnomonas acidicola TaxID=399579 RepID=UPI0009467C6A|nr:ABC transporter substrate-binding protein [Thermogymnomonas acidicola]
MVSKKVIAAVVVVVVVIVAAVAVIELYHPQKIYHPTVFTDVSQTAAPSEGLDPATGFFTTDEPPLFTALYQQLVEYNVTSFNVVPVIAQSVTYNVSNPMVYNFTLRPYVTFSNGMPVNATDVWFSIYRGILMAQAPYASDFGNILFNDTIFADYSIEIPWGHRPRAQGCGIHDQR